MNQTLMGLLGLMIAMLLSLNVQRASLSAKAQVIDNEMETIASGVALEVLDYVGSKPFDAATALGEVEDESELTTLPFSTGNAYEEADDIDDFHQIETYSLPEFDFDFDIDITIEYVDEDDPEVVATSQTFAKKVTVTINNEYLESPVQLSQVYTYP